MGIPSSAAKLLFEEAKRRPFKGRVLTLGRQFINFSYVHLEKIAAESKFKLFDPGELALSHVPKKAKKGYMSDVCFLKALGFSESRALDFTPSEAPDYIFDLNSGEMTEGLLGAFDVIINGGTIEHIFHIPNVLNNIFRMLASDGRIIHFSPISARMDHGFYMFSPTLFRDYYRANKFEIDTFQIFLHSKSSLRDWLVVDYHPGCSNEFDGVRGGMLGAYCVVTKTKNSTGDAVPVQGRYVKGIG